MPGVTECRGRERWAYRRTDCHSLLHTHGSCERADRLSQDCWPADAHNDWSLIAVHIVAHCRGRAVPLNASVHIGAELHMAMMSTLRGERRKVERSLLSLTTVGTEPHNRQS